MKLLGKIALMVLAADVFAQYPEEQKVFAREDGNIFFMENYAQLNRGKLKIYPIERTELTVQIAAVEAKKIEVIGEEIVSTGEPEPKAPLVPEFQETPATEVPEASETEPSAPAPKPAENKAAPKKTASNKATGKDGKNPENRTTNKPK